MEFLVAFLFFVLLAATIIGVFIWMGGEREE